MSRFRKKPAPADTINWNEVGNAAYRSKLGRSREGDFDLCCAAYAADPERYSKVVKPMHDKAVQDSMDPFGVHT